MNRVLIAPAPMREIEPVYGPLLQRAGLELVWPKRNAQLTEAELLDQLPGCVAVVAGSEPYTPRVLEVAANAGLLAVCRAGVGYDGVDVAAATRNGIAVGYAPGTNQDAVAEHAVMLMLALCRKLLEQHKLTVSGNWPRRAVRALRGSTVGVIGLGRTGKAVATRLAGFDVKLIACDPYAGADFAAARGIALLPADEVFRQADIVTLHVPHTPETAQIVSARTLGLMKPHAFLINTARGPVVDEVALCQALAGGKIAGAGLDVFVDEPLPGEHPFCRLPNVILTAHVAGVDLRSRDDMVRVGTECVVELLAGRWPAEWVVNPEVRPAFELRLRR